MTLDDQLAALLPLSQGVVGRLAGLTNRGTLTVKRARGGVLSYQQLEAIEARLLALVETVRELKGAAR